MRRIKISYDGECRRLSGTGFPVLTQSGGVSAHVSFSTVDPSEVLTLNPRIVHLNFPLNQPGREKAPLI